MRSWNRSLLILLCFLMLQGAAWASETAYNLGVHAYRAKDYAGARQRWQKAVAEGEPSAMNNLGFLLFHALGGPRDEQRAVSLWTLAAKSGHSESQWHLAHAFEEGKGVERDLMQAYAWYRCAVAGMPAIPRDDDDRSMIADARKALGRVLDRLPETRVAEAEGRARACVRQFGKASGNSAHSARP